MSFLKILSKGTGNSRKIASLNLPIPAIEIRDFDLLSEQAITQTISLSDIANTIYTNIKYSPDNTMIAVYGAKVFSLYDVATGNLLYIDNMAYYVSTKQITIEFTPDSKYVVFPSNRGTADYDISVVKLEISTLTETVAHVTSSGGNTNALVSFNLDYSAIIVNCLSGTSTVIVVYEFSLDLSSKANKLSASYAYCYHAFFVDRDSNTYWFMKTDTSSTTLRMDVYDSTYTKIASPLTAMYFSGATVMKIENRNINKISLMYSYNSPIAVFDTARLKFAYSFSPSMLRKPVDVYNALILEDALITGRGIYSGPELENFYTFYYAANTISFGITVSN